MITNIKNTTSVNEIIIINNIKGKRIIFFIYAGSLILKTKSRKFIVVHPDDYIFPLFNKLDRCHGY